MSIKISGLKLLSANYYERISIIQTDVGYNVYIKRTKPSIPTQSVYSLSKDVNNKTQLFQSVSPAFHLNRKQNDEAKVGSVISSFLQYTTINQIIPRWSQTKDCYDIVMGTRQLRLQVNSPTSEMVKQMVFKKYLEDRLKFCSQHNDVKKITIMSAGVASYGLYRNECKEEIRVYLLMDLAETQEYEQQFLQRIITDKLNQCGTQARIECDLPFIIGTNSYVPGFVHLICGEIEIDVFSDKELIDIANQLVDKHNQELEQNKIIQLKMEGF